ncbi:hypothetical protein IPC1293_31195 [Pseudomonas aeruginosa]|nr:hypothetical protein AXW94_30140 [Pseudomonas aeruginosa]RPM25838.1 hypothetical protein IPC1293_31195 [Pseudomonas aeruginosa]
MSNDIENSQPEEKKVTVQQKPNYPACQREITSQVILNLPEDSRPKERVICMSCEQATWITSVQKRTPQIDCFCRVMRTMTYSTFNPTEVLDCDVIYMLEAAKED